ncbi:unnamed protein product [Cercospora beticola]|nr:unnamed protein product [Cercospora beticola]
MSAFRDLDNGLPLVASAEQNELMDAIDRLRPLSLQHELELPQLIVCGKQSSGKSSVLEAISHIPFPIGRETTTRFATELVLRNASDENISASIVPSAGTSTADLAILREFDPDVQRLSDFSRVLREASDHLKRLVPPGKLSSHRLRIELSGPQQPHLTLIDMPGLMLNATSGFTESDIESVRTVMKEYMRQPKSIILALMPASDDLADHEVLQFAAEADPEGVRTLGILTKPDRIEDDESRAVRIKVVQNEEIPLKLGWHVLRNLGPGVETRSAEDRDREEADFFADPGSVWSTVAPAKKGVAALRARLRSILLRSIADTLPALTSEIELRISALDQHLIMLGPPRMTSNEQLSYLDNISREMSTLIDQACKGTYDEPFFTSALTNDGNNARLLRTRIRDLYDDFYQHMIDDGQLYHIVDGETRTCSVHDRSVHSGEIVLGRTTSPLCVSYQNMAKAVLHYIGQFRAQELDGEPPAVAIGQVFRLMATPWQHLGDALAIRCIDAARYFFCSALNACAPSHTANAIYERMVASRFESCRGRVRLKVKELTTPYQSPFPITKNPLYRSNLRSYDLKAIDETARLEGPLRNIEEAANLARRPEHNVLNAAAVYYEIAVHTFIDNIMTLAIENCIMTPLKDMFNVRKALQLDDASFAAITAEPNEVVTSRKSSAEDLQVFTEVLEVCNRHKFFAGTNSLEEDSSADHVQLNNIHRAATPTTSPAKLRASSDGLLAVSRQDAAMRTPPRNPENDARERGTTLGMPLPQDESSAAIRDLFDPDFDASSTPQIDQNEHLGLPHNGTRTAQRRQPQHRGIFTNNNI